MKPRVRFAPSPTGRLHIGNIRTAALNWLYARKHKGSFLLRLDATDTVRSTEEFAQAIRDDLEWLGLIWDEEARQQDRTARYEAMAATLKAKACFILRSSPRKNSTGGASGSSRCIVRRFTIVAALKLSDSEVAEKLRKAENRIGAFVFRTPRREQASRRSRRSSPGTI